MSKLNIDQQTIFQLFSDKKSDFLIPDYQRPYAWEEKECQQLWDDIFEFAFPGEDYSQFDDDNDEYFLGPIVTFKNSDGKQEIIDGQQRLTTLMLLLRAFHTRFLNMQDTNSVQTRDSMAKCIWKTDPFGTLKKEELKIESEVSTDEDREEFLTILKTGIADKTYKSRYASIYRFFEDRINDFINKYPTYSAYLPARIMNNCILLPIEAESQDTALRIFSTLNDRGKPLSDSDSFKAQFYNYFSEQGRKDEFIRRWKDLEMKCEERLTSQQGSPMDDLFTRYMYYIRAKQGIRHTTTEALRKFYEKDKYSLLKSEQTLEDLEALAEFWNDIKCQNEEVFSTDVLRKLFIINYGPNSMWEYLTSVYFMANKDKKGRLDQERFLEFLDISNAFILAYSFERPGVNALRTPLYPEMINIVQGKQVEFLEHKFDGDTIYDEIEDYIFANQRPITRSILTWWTFKNKKQPIYKLDEKLEIEHIYAKKRQENEKGLKEEWTLEALGNKALLEKRINIRAADYRFEDKKKYYTGFTTDSGVVKEGTKNRELLEMAKKKEDFKESDIIDREDKIFEEFVNYLDEMNLLKNSND